MTTRHFVFFHGAEANGRLSDAVTCSMFSFFSADILHPFSHTTSLAKPNTILSEAKHPHVNILNTTTNGTKDNVVTTFILCLA